MFKTTNPQKMHACHTYTALWLIKTKPNWTIKHLHVLQASTDTNTEPGVQDESESIRKATKPFFLNSFLFTLPLLFFILKTFLFYFPGQ